jgi:hypothetical protein
MQMFHVYTGTTQVPYVELYIGFNFDPLYLLHLYLHLLYFTKDFKRSITDFIASIVVCFQNMTKYFSTSILVWVWFYEFWPLH